MVQSQWGNNQLISNSLRTRQELPDVVPVLLTISWPINWKDNQLEGPYHDQFETWCSPDPAKDQLIFGWLQGPQQGLKQPELVPGASLKDVPGMPSVGPMLLTISSSLLFRDTPGFEPQWTPMLLQSADCPLVGNCIGAQTPLSFLQSNNQLIFSNIRPTWGSPSAVLMLPTISWPIQAMVWYLIQPTISWLTTGTDCTRASWSPQCGPTNHMFVLCAMKTSWKIATHFLCKKSMAGFTL